MISNINIEEMDGWKNTAGATDGMVMRNTSPTKTFSSIIGLELDSINT
jgi:hypothetical protein